MSTTRRRFLQGASLSLLAATIPPLVFAQNSSVTESDTFAPENLTIFNGVSQQTFQPWIGTRFKVSADYKQLGSLMLLSVNEATVSPKATTNRNAIKMVEQASKASQQSLVSFVLRLQGSGSTLAQGTYTLQHSGLGRFPLFLVPSSEGQTQPTYTAVFTILN